jgi:hypothetical protein
METGEGLEITGSSRRSGKLRKEEYNENKGVSYARHRNCDSAILL